MLAYDKNIVDFLKTYFLPLLPPLFEFAFLVAAAEVVVGAADLG